MRAALGAALVVATIAGCADDNSPESDASTRAATPPASDDSATAATTAAAATTAPTTSASASTVPRVAGRQPEGFTTMTLELSGAAACCVWLADVSDERSRGLMRVTDLGEAVGMLFAYPGEQSASFYMFNTVMPLSIAFFDGAGRFVSSTDMDPCRSRDSTKCPRYQAEGPYRYALEVPQDELEALGIGPGTTITPGAETDGCASS